MERVVWALSVLTPCLTNMFENFHLRNFFSALEDALESLDTEYKLGLWSAVNNCPVSGGQPTLGQCQGQAGPLDGPARLG